MITLTIDGVSHDVVPDENALGALLATLAPTTVIAADRVASDSPEGALLLRLASYHSLVVHLTPPEVPARNVEVPPLEAPMLRVPDDPTPVDVGDLEAHE